MNFWTDFFLLKEVDVDNSIKKQLMSTLLYYVNIDIISVYVDYV